MTLFLVGYFQKNGAHPFICHISWLFELKLSVKIYGKNVWSKIAINFLGAICSFDEHSSMIVYVAKEW